VTASCLVFFSGTRSAPISSAMRYEEDDPKRPPPQPVRGKGDNWGERQEYAPHEVGPSRKDDDRDRHRHVRC